MQTLHPVGAVAQHVQDLLAGAGHDGHIQHHVDGVGDLNAYLGEGGADGAHGVGDNIHGAALIAATGNVKEHLIGLLGVHPVVCRARVLLLLGADEGAALYPGHVVDGGAVVVAVGELLLVKLDHLACFAGLTAQVLDLLLRAVDPHHIVGRDQLLHFLKPVEDGLVVGHDCIDSFRK